MDKAMENCLGIAHAIDTKKMNIIRECLSKSIIKACKSSNITDSDKIEVQLLLSHYRLRLLQYMLGVALPAAILSRMLSKNSKQNAKKRFPTSSRVEVLEEISHLGGKIRGGVNAKQALTAVFTALFFVNVGNSVVDRGHLDNDGEKIANYVDLMGEQREVPDKYTLFAKDPSDAARGLVKSAYAPPEILHFSQNEVNKNAIELLRATLDEYNAKIDDAKIDADLRPFLKLELDSDNSLSLLLPLETIGESLVALKNAHEDWLKSPANLVNYIPSLETVTTEWAPALAATAVSYYAGSTSWDDKMAIFQGISDLSKSAAKAAIKAAPQIGDVALKVSKVALKNPQAAAGVAVFGAQVAVDLGNNYVVKPTADAIKAVDNAYDRTMSTITGHQEGPINAVIEMQNKLKEVDAIISKLSVSTKAVLDGKKTDSVRLFASPNIKEIMKWANWKSEGKVIISAIRNFLGLSAYIAKGTAEFGAEAIKIEFKLGKEHFFENVATLWSILVYIVSTSFYSNCVTAAFIYSLFRLYSSNKKGKGASKRSNTYQDDDYEENAHRNTRRRAPANKRTTVRKQKDSESPPPAEEQVPAEIQPRRSTRRVVQVPVSTRVTRSTRSQAAAEPEHIAEGQQYSEQQRELMREAMSKFSDIKKAKEVIERIKNGDYSDFENRSRSRSNSRHSNRSRSRSNSRHSNRSREEGEVSEGEQPKNTRTKRSPSSSPHNQGD